MRPQVNSAPCTGNKLRRTGTLYSLQCCCWGMVVNSNKTDAMAHTCRPRSNLASTASAPSETAQPRLHTDCELAPVQQRAMTRVAVVLWFTTLSLYQNQLLTWHYTKKRAGGSAVTNSFNQKSVSLDLQSISVQRPRVPRAYPAGR